MVYFIADSDGYGEGCYIKIGYTDNNIKRRLGELQTGNPKPLYLLWAEDGGIAVEKKIHNLLSEFKATGEWFYFNKEVADLLRNFSRSRFTNHTHKHIEECCVCGI